MATDNSNELGAFHQFVGSQLETGANLSPEEVLDQWRAEHPLELSEDENEEIVAMAQEALDDLATGVPCISSEKFERELEREFGLKPPKRRS